MSRRQTGRQHEMEPDVAFLDALEIDDEPALRRLEVYEEARQLREQVMWLVDERATPADYVASPRGCRRGARGPDTRHGARR